MVLVSSVIHVFLFWNQNIYFMLLDIESMRLDFFFIFRSSHWIFKMFNFLKIMGRFKFGLYLIL